jgi:TonB family protein
MKLPMHDLPRYCPRAFLTLMLIVYCAARAQETPAAAPGPQRQHARVLDIAQCKPVYPKESTRTGEEGATQVRLRIGADGRLLDAQVARSSGFERLDKAALDALSQCRFAATTQDGVPRESTLVLTYNWRLEPAVTAAPAPECLKLVEYPTESIHAQEQGTTVLRMWFTAAHQVERVELAKSSGSARLDAAALTGLQRCKFRLRGVESGTAPKEPAHVEFVWRISDESPPTMPAVPTGPVQPDPYRPL